MRIGIGGDGRPAATDVSDLPVTVVGGRVTLPDLTVEPVDGPVWLLGVEAAAGDVDQALADRLAKGWGVGSRELPGRIVLPGETVEWGGAAAATVRVTAFFHERMPDGKWAAHHVAASIGFVLRASVVPEPPTDEEPRFHHGVLAVDFGTTASTVTLWDQWLFPITVLPASQAAVLRDEVVALLRSRPDPRDRVSAAWDRLRGDVAARCLPDTGARTVDQLIWALERERGDETPLLHQVLLTLDTSQPALPPPLGEWLADRIQTAYGEVFRAPAPDRSQLHEVPLGPGGEPIIDSTVEVSRTDGVLSVRLGRPLTVTAAGDESLVLTGLKRHLGRSEAQALEERGIRTDEVIARAIAQLVDQANKYAGQTEGMDHRPINKVVVTYPTAAPGAVRRKLRDLVSEAAGITEVTITYDEAVAVAFFFLMRELGSHLEVGVEALRARMRPTGNPAARTENVLVIDIGGGTTDIALFTFDLYDVSPVGLRVPEHLQGKVYKVVPTLRGTNGREHRGGDYLTLGVYHWIKAVLADALLQAGPLPDGRSWLDDAVRRIDKFENRNNALWTDDRYRPGALIEEELHHLRGGAGWAQNSRLDLPHRRAAELAAPTHWKDRRESRATFHLLWRLAEQAKTGELGGGRPFELTAERLAPVLRSMAKATGTDPEAADRLLASLPVPLVLRPELFEQIARPALRQVAKLAIGLVHSRFQGNPQPLDRLILTGRASRMPLVEQVIAEEFAAAAADEAVIEWNPAALVVDLRSAKSATSIGAAWVERMRRLAAHNRDALTIVTRGATEITVDVQNIFQTLPASFSVTRHSQPYPVLHANDPFDQVRPDGTVSRRTYLGPLSRTVLINRVIDGDTAGKQWGAYDLSDTVRKQKYRPAQEALDALNLNIDPSRVEWLAGIQTNLEIDQTLELTLHLWRDRGEERPAEADPTPTYLVPAVGGLELLAPAGRLASMLSTRGKTPVIAEVAGRIMLRNGAGDDLVQLPVFRRDDTLQPVELTEEFAAEQSLTGEFRAGVVSPEPLPAPGRDGWTFFLRDGDRVEALGTLPARNHAGDWYATLDDAGVLRVQAGKPDYLRARSLAEMDEHKGAVYSTPMDPGAEKDESSDPYNGEQ
ncbi:virulence factor SrfB [Actinoplanes ianthinogenes]|uniref:virulence factor SrfB n=1 Tax=Actinoplanes ianthinogenes TaxID=122358 RepID=UPI00167010EC|nr:virulence factor SrfB [Actinoplanes ianthinogenes]